VVKIVYDGARGIDVQFSWLKPWVWDILKVEVVGSNPAKKLTSYKFMNLS
jgi:hypothetical protein